MVECLQELGLHGERASRTRTNSAIARSRSTARAGRSRRGGTEEQPLELFVGNAGTAARFLAAMVCLGKGVYRLHGVPRMHERPQAALFQALRELGYRVDSPNDKLPALIFGSAEDGRESSSARYAKVHASASRRVRSLPRRCCCARSVADGRSKCRARMRRNRRMWR